MFYLKAGFHMIADRRSQIADRNKVCDRLRSYGNYFCAPLRSCDRDRRRSQKIEPCSISCDRLRSIAIVCDLRSAIIWKPAFRQNMVLSSAILCDHDRRIADDRRSSFHMIADNRRPYCDQRSAIIWKPALNVAKKDHI